MYKKGVSSIFNFINGFEIFNGILCTLIINLMTIAIAFYSMQIFDKVFTSSDLLTLIYLTLITILLILLTIIITNYRFKQLQLIYNKYCKIILKKIKNCRNTILNEKIINNLFEINQYYRTNILVSIFDIVVSPIYLLVLYIIHPALFIFSFFAVLFCYFWDIIFYNKTLKFQQRLAKNHDYIGKINNYLGYNNNLSNILIKYNILKDFSNNYSRFNGKQNSYLQLLNNLQIYNKNYRLIIQILATMTSSYLVLINKISIGSIIAFSILLSRFLEPFTNLANQIKNLLNLQNLLNENNKILESDFTNSNITILSIKKIILEKIYFYCPQNHDHKIKISYLKIEENSIIAVISKNKSEFDIFIKLIMGIVEPNIGKVSINDINISNLSPQNLISQTNFIEKNFDYFSENIVQNIANHQSNINLDQMLNFIDNFGNIEDLKKLKDNFYHQISDLTPDQKSLINLLSAFYNESSFLVVGEHDNFIKFPWFYNKILTHSAKIKLIYNPSSSFIKQCKHLIIINDGIVEFKSQKFIDDS